MTQEAVADLLAAAELPDPNGWTANNIAAALQLASLDITAWEGEEWALESGEHDEALDWAGAEDTRIPFAWLRAKAVDRDAHIGIYQDDSVFGLSFIPATDPPALGPPTGSLRPRHDIPLVTGRITAVDLAYDTLIDGGSAPGLTTEALLHGDRRSTLLLAAEAYSRNEWRLHDESVVAVREPATADTLDWIPARRPWTPTATRAQ
jgi:hypothetical protein